MQFSHRLTDLFRSLALVGLLFATLFFVYFGLSPAVELLPAGMDMLVGILFGLFVLVSVITMRGKHRRR
jgi:hypothetical protein